MTYTHCCKCRKRLKVKKGFAERCACRGKMTVTEAVNRFKNLLAHIEVGGMSDNHGASARAKRCESTRALKGLKK